MGFLKRNSGCLLVALCAWALKWHYSTATSDELDWILSPTAWLVSQLSGLPFVRETGVGYHAREAGIVIAPACAGVNFLIMCFCMLGFSYQHHVQDGFARWRWVFMSAAIAYAVTLIVNTLRIILSVWTYRSGLSLDDTWMASIHRVEGVALYFPALLLIHGIVSCVMRGSQLKAGMIPPIFWYLAIALGIPLLRGTLWNSPASYGEHACWVIGTMTVVLIVSLISRWFTTRLGEIGRRG